ncbi:UPF0496 protein 1-like [Dendrobium catenatum]|uniref:UPF0496 protein 1 n=1 Tax=Dendrobium catenatum TaxID=906689 RepID=A0A2I0WLS8_9ASPA|nr:UPF0496 protein 1-like [Dendrobium catenatum]PKU76612.1 UPF0496 protein 1 [Dendrobium catenatum]
MGCHSSKMPHNPLIPLRSPFSFDSLKQAITFLLEKNKEVVCIILDCKKTVRKNPKLFLLVKDYFDKGLHNLDFCTALENCLNNAQNFLHEADPTLKYEKAKDELKRFKESVDLFAKEFLDVFNSVNQQQLSLLEKLLLEKQRIDKKLKSAQALRKLFSIIFASASAVLLISSIVSAIVGAPPIATAIFAAFSAMGTWLDSMWNNYREAIKREKMIISALKAGTSAGINEMDGIKAMVNMVQDQISCLLENSHELNFSAEIEENWKKMKLFMKNIEDLVLQADQCRRDLKRGRTAVYEKLVNAPTDVMSNNFRVSDS